MIKEVLRFVAVMGVCLTMSGCLTSINTVGPDMKPFAVDPAEKQEADGEAYCIRSIVDTREFKKSSIDYRDPTWIADEKRKPLAIARQRNGFGGAMGAIVLPEDLPPAEVVRKVLTKALVETGHQVVQDEKEARPGTKMLDVDIARFWMWCEMRFMHCYVAGDIETDISVDGGFPMTVTGHYSRNAGGVADRHWRRILNDMVEDYYKQLVRKFKRR